MDLRRLGGIVVVSVGVVLGLCAYRALLAASRPCWPVWLRNDWATKQLDSYRMAGGQLAGLVRQGVPSGHPVGVLLGASALTCGINPALLASSLAGSAPGTGQAAAKVPERWVRLVGTGASTCELEGITRLMLESGIRPAVLVVALEAKMLARSDRYLDGNLHVRHDFDVNELIDHLRSLRPGAVKWDVMKLAASTFAWGFPDRPRMTNRLQSRVLLARMAALRSIGRDSLAMFPPLDQPWAVDFDWVNTPDTSLDHRLAAREDMRRCGFFDASNYGETTVASRSLRALIDQARAAGTQVVVLLLPEPKLLRAEVPETALTTLSTLLKATPDSPAIPLLDLRQSLDEDQFRDFVHVNRTGRQALTRKLASNLEPLILVR